MNIFGWKSTGRGLLRPAKARVRQDRLSGVRAYPVANQHYFSGFVLYPEDKAQWSDIAFASEQAIARGTAQTYIWALPQVARDGFTYFEIAQEEGPMRCFDDILFPLEIGRDAMAAAEFSTNIVTTLSGHEHRNSSWSDARLSFDAGPGVRSETELSMLIDFFRARRGAAIGFRFTDPFDFSSNQMVAEPTMLDQILGVGDGIRRDFPLMKKYGEEAQSRRITRPRKESVSVALDGEKASDWSLAEKGIIEFASPPAVGTIASAGFLFDVPVRFAEDRIEVSRATFGAGDIPHIPLIEIKE